MKLCTSLAAALLIALVGFSTIAHAELYWDVDGATAGGSGSTTAAGTWGVNNFWSTSSAGTAATGAWVAGETAVFSAGTDVTGTYTVTLSGTQSISGITFEEGDVTISGGTELTLAGSSANPGDFNGDGVVNAADYVALRKTGGSHAVFVEHFGETGGAGLSGTMNVAAGRSATITSSIGGVGARLVKTGAGNLTLNGTSTYDGGTTVGGGKLSFPGEDFTDAIGPAPALVVPDHIILSGGGVLANTMDDVDVAFMFAERGVTIGAGGGGFEVTAPTARLGMLSEIAGSEKWTKSGPGTLSLLDSTNPFTGGFKVTGGKLIHSTFESATPAPGTLRASGVEPADVVPDYVILDGGTIEYNNTGAGSTFLSNRKGITLTANGGALSLPGQADPAGNGSISNYFGKVSAPDGAILYKRGHGEIRPNKQSAADDGGWDHTKLVVEEGLYRVGNLGEEGLFGKVPVAFLADAIRIAGQGTTRVDGAAAIGLTSGATHNLVTTTPATRGILIEANGGTICTSLGIGSWIIESIISGPGALNINGNGFPITGAGDFATATSTLVFEGANSYVGGTFVNSGILQLDGAAASLGTGNVTVDGTTAGYAGQLKILAGVSNAIANSATLSLTGGGTIGTADVGYVELGAGINETVNQLVLGGVGQAPGTYGATGSGATNILDEYFAGSGIVTVLSAGSGGGGAVPEPTSVLLMILGLSALALRQRGSRSA